MPPLCIRQLRDLMRYRFKLTNFGSSEKNRMQNCLTVSNIQLGSVVSDTFGKSSMKITRHLLENPDDRDFDFVPLLHGSMKGKADSIRLALHGMITVDQQQKMKIIPCHYSEIKKCKTDLESVILRAIRAICQAMLSGVYCTGYQKSFFCYRYNIRNRC